MPPDLGSPSPLLGEPQSSGSRDFPRGQGRGGGSIVLLLGDPVAESFSPAFHNAAFEAMGIDCRYQVRRVTPLQLAITVDEIRNDSRILGANVTIPHKESVVRLLDELDPLAGRLRAVNTISKHGPLLKGWNTDVVGFTRALEESGFRAAGKRAAIIGAGGAARAVAAALQPTVATLWVIARNADRARRLCLDLGIDHGGPMSLDQMETVIGQVDLVVNATPADLPQASLLAPHQRFFDIRSRRSNDGRAMLLYQGPAAFEIWTGRPAPLEVMRAALENAAAERTKEGARP